MARRLLAAGLLGLLVLSGCGGSPPEDPPTSAPSPSPTSTTPPAPELPEEAKANTKAGAEAFVRYYVDLINRTQVSGEPQLIRDASLPTCRTCTSALDVVIDLHDRGATIDGGQWTLKSTEVSRPETPPGSDPVAVVHATIDAARQVVHEPGKKPVTYPAGVVKYFFTLTWTRTGWKVAAWDTA